MSSQKFGLAFILDERKEAMVNGGNSFIEIASCTIESSNIPFDITMKVSPLLRELGKNTICSFFLGQIVKRDRREN